MNEAIVQIVMRYVHLACAILVVGGMAFISWCVWPGLRLLDDGFRATVEKLIVRRFMKVVYIAIAGLLVSGLYNWMLNAAAYRALKPWGEILIGTKVLLALVIFGVVFARAAGLIKPSRFWHTLNLHLAAVVILLAGILHYLRTH